MVWRITPHPAGDVPSRGYPVCAPEPRDSEAQARLRPERPGAGTPVTDKEAP